MSLRDDIQSGLLRAVRAGVRLRQLETALSAPLQAPPTDPLDSSGDVIDPPGDVIDPSRRHWLRVLGRRGLRLVRPLALPFLNRFEWRIRTAIDKSHFAATIKSQFRASEMHMTELAKALIVQNADVTALRREVAEHASVQNAHVTRLRREVAEPASVRLDDLTRETTRLMQHVTELRAALAEQEAQVTTLRREIAERVSVRLDDLARGTDRLLQRGVVPLAGGDYLTRTPLGWLVAPGEDERLLMALIETGGALAPGTVAVLTALSRQGDTVVDVGAHIGTTVIPTAYAVGPRGHVIAVEPGARAAALLRRSLHINSLASRVTLHDCAAGAARGEATLHIAPVIGENSLIPPSGENEGHASARVAVQRLDDLVPPGPVRVVKIDAEGYELDVWKGMRRIIADNPKLAVIVEFGSSHLARGGISVAEWFDPLQASGFTPWEIDEASQTLRAARPLADRAGIFSINLLLLRAPPSAYPGLRVS